MPAPKKLSAAEVAQMIEQLETMADTMFAAGNNMLGNQLQDVIHSMEANYANNYAC